MATAKSAARHPSAAPRPSHRREATRRRLLDAARRVFAERGFHGASVEEICEQAGFTRGAFYSNFASKDDLVLDLYDQHTARLRERITELADQPDLTIQQILEGVFTIWTHDEAAGQRRWHLLLTEFTLHAMRDPAAGRAWARQQRALRVQLADVVERIAGDRGLRSPVDAEQFVRAAMALFNGAMTQHLLEPRKVIAGELERAFLPAMVGALFEAPGRQPC